MSRPTNSNAMSEIVVVSGVGVGPESLPVYAGLLAGKSALSMRERFIPMPHRGSGDLEEIYGEVSEKLDTIYDRLEEPFVLVGHSGGGHVATRAAVDKPHMLREVNCIAGLQEGVIEENIAVKGIRRGIEFITLTHSQYELVQHDHDYMKFHREQIATRWSPRVRLNLYSPRSDIVFRLPHGLNIKLPKGQIAHPYVVGRSQQEIELIEGMPKNVKSLPSSKYLFNDHFTFPSNPTLISHVRSRRRNLVTNENNYQQSLRAIPALAA